MCAEVEKLKRSMAVRRPVVGVLVEAAAAGEDDERDLGVAEHGELVRLLEEAVAALAEGHLPVGRVLDALDLSLALAPAVVPLCSRPKSSSNRRGATRGHRRRLLQLQPRRSQGRLHTKTTQKELACVRWIDGSAANSVRE